MLSDVEAARRWLTDIREHISLAQEFTATHSQQTFEADRMCVFAVIRCLEVVSEASRRLPEAFKASYPDIAWPAIAASGNIYRHEYEVVSPQRLWITVTRDLPRLSDVVSRKLEGLADPLDTVPTKPD